MLLLRRRAALGGLLAPFVAPARAAPAWPLSVTDAAGRRVTLPRPPRAVLLGTGFHLVALSLLHPDPVSLLAGWADDMRRANPPLAGAFAARFPALNRVPLVTGGGTESLSLEKALSVGADLALLGRWQLASEAGRALLQGLTEAGVPVVVLDFALDPLATTPASMRLLGRLLGREAEGEAFARFHEAHREVIRACLTAHPGPRPSVLLHAFAGAESCCWAWGDAGLGRFVTAAGGRNLGAELLPQSPGGMLHLEAVIAQDPAVYVTTGLPGAAVTIGPGVSPEAARRSLAAALEAPGLSGLSAVRAGRAHALWNHFNAVPLNILALEALARWSRPDLFRGLDPAATLAEINQRFAAVPFKGCFWISLKPD